MKTITITFLSFFYAIIINSAEFRMDAYGYDKSKLYSLSENHIYVDYSNDAIVLTTTGISGTAICDGIIEIINDQSTSNIMCELTEKNGDTAFMHFKQTSGAAIATEGTQQFLFVAGTGRWKELVGQKCISANSPVVSKKVSEGNFEGRYIWTGKCNVTDATLERVINYTKPQ